MKVPTVIVPLIVLASIASGVVLGQRLPAPTFIQDFERAEVSGHVARVDLVVDNLRCRGRSAFLGQFLEADPGVIRLETYVGEMRARIVFDPERTNLESLRERIESRIRVPLQPQRALDDADDFGAGAVRSGDQQFQWVQPFSVAEIKSQSGF